MPFLWVSLINLSGWIGAVLLHLSKVPGTAASNIHVNHTATRHSFKLDIYRCNSLSFFVIQTATKLNLAPVGGVWPTPPDIRKKTSAPRWVLTKARRKMKSMENIQYEGLDEDISGAIQLVL